VPVVDREEGVILRANVRESIWHGALVPGFWYANSDGVLAELVRMGDPVPNEPGLEVLSIGQGVGGNDSEIQFRHRVYLRQTIFGTPVYHDVISTVREGGELRIVAREPDPVFGSFEHVDFGYSAGATILGTSSERRSITAIVGGVPRTVARQDASVPGDPDGATYGFITQAVGYEDKFVVATDRANLRRFDLTSGAVETILSNEVLSSHNSHLTINSSGTVGVRRNVGPNGSSYFAFARGAPPREIWGSDDVSSDFLLPPNVRIGGLLAVENTDRGHFFVVRNLYGPDMDDRSYTAEALLLYPKRGDPSVILRAGQLLEVAAGDLREVDKLAVAARGNQGKWVNEFGEAVLSVAFRDGSEAIVIAEIPLTADEDADGLPDLEDNCPAVANPNQEDRDGDETGDACNDAEDSDGDEFADGLDNCPEILNADQRDTDESGIGDACNDSIDADGDEFEDGTDTCPLVSSPIQTDDDFDGLGDPCDPYPGDRFNFGAIDDLLAAQQEIVELTDARDRALDDLEQCLLSPPFLDADGDGEHDSTDRCPDTPPDSEVDDDGCDLKAFCGAIEIEGFRSLRDCHLADWRNDEIARSARDCVVSRRGIGLVCAARSSSKRSRRMKATDSGQSNDLGLGRRSALGWPTHR